MIRRCLFSHRNSFLVLALALLFAPLHVAAAAADFGGFDEADGSLLLFFKYPYFKCVFVYYLLVSASTRTRFITTMYHSPPREPHETQKQKQSKAEQNQTGRTQQAMKPPTAAMTAAASMVHMPAP